MWEVIKDVKYYIRHMKTLQDIARLKFDFARFNMADFCGQV
jgi:hypothetical protein